MKKIASPQELKAELQRLLAYSQESQPSREKITAELLDLADRVAGTTVDKKLLDALGHWTWDKKDDVWQLRNVFLKGQMPSPQAINKVRLQLKKLLSGNPGQAFWGDLKGPAADAELRWLVLELGELLT